MAVPPPPARVLAPQLQVLTLKEVAGRLRRSYKFVQQAVKARRIPAKWDGRWVVTEADLARYLENLPEGRTG